jgi:hypothetical protein
VALPRLSTNVLKLLLSIDWQITSYGRGLQGLWPQKAVAATLGTRIPSIHREEYETLPELPSTN